MARNKYPEETVKLILDAATRLFTKKGYDATSLQDIINDTNLSKGAIYHHFASKEEIFEAIAKRSGEKNSTALAKIRDDHTLSGIEKLQSIFKTALFDSNQSLMLAVTPCLLDNPRFLAMQIRQTYQIVVPEFIRPILQQGMDDGTIKLQNPDELAEAIMILLNVWLNPLINMTDENGMRNRCITFNTLLQCIGMDLLDEEMINGFASCCKETKNSVE